MCSQGPWLGKELARRIQEAGFSKKLGGYLDITKLLEFARNDAVMPGIRQYALEPIASFLGKLMETGAMDFFKRAVR